MSNLNTARYAAADWPEVEKLLRKSPKPLSIHRQFSPQQVEELVVARGAAAFSHEKTVGWVARESESIVGSLTLTDRDWDTAQLGMRAGTVDCLVAGDDEHAAHNIKISLLEHALRDAHARKIQYITARVDASDLSSIHALEQQGFITLDSIVTFARTTSDTTAQARDKDVEIRLAGPLDADAAGRLARVAFRYDRFHSDPAIPKIVADRLHEEWVSNSCLGTAADGVLLAFHRNQLAGLVTCKIQNDSPKYLGKTIGTIVLVATAAEYRGKGIATLTTMASLEWFRKRGVDLVEVGTQIRNLPAMRLYPRCGFEIAAASYSLRKLN